MGLENVADYYPLSPLQEGLLYHSLSESSSQVYFNQMLATLQGSFDEPAFKRAWEMAVEQHAILRTFFVWENVKAPVQVVEKSVAVPYESVDWRGLTGPEQEERLLLAQRQDLERGFELNRAPLMRLKLFRTGDDSREFLWSFHHILMDGWGMFQILKDVFDAYALLAEGQAPALRTRRPYRDYIAWLKRQDMRLAEMFWRRRLSGFSAPTPLIDIAPSDPETRDEVMGEEYEKNSLTLPAETMAALDRFCRSQRITLSTLIQAAWALLLSRYSSEPDVVFGTIVSGRPASLSGVEEMVGLFINTLPVRARPLPRLRVSSWLQTLQAEQAEMLEYQFSPLAEVQGWSDVAGGVSLFDSILMFENYHKDTPLEEMGGALKIDNVRWFERVNYPLVALVEPGEQLHLRLVSRRSRFDTATMARMLEHWRALIEGMVEAPEARLQELQILSPTEREQLLVTWNDTRSNYPSGKCIHELFSAQASATPQAPALSFAGETLTYEELDRRSSQLANYLRRHDAGREVRVAVCLQRSLELIVGILGILKAGAAYVPLDPDYPEERLAFMLEDTQAPILLTSAGLTERLPQHAARLVRLDADWELVARESAELPETDVAPENLAYVMYTSGSTGRPKGTSVPHRAVVRLVKESDYATFGPAETFLQFAPISFDAATFEIWGSLLNGSRLVIYPAERPSLEALGEIILREGVSTVWLTAGLFHEMVQHNLEGLSPVRQLLAGGDVLSVTHVRTAAEALKDCTIINGYGPTENTTFSCCYAVSEPGNLGASVPVGRPISNTRAYILDHAMQPVPVGVPGMLYVAGDGLARDYQNRPALTAERFLPNPFSQSPGERLYCTGDLARYLADGNIEFLGRKDHQVKVRGYRIELGEIETALSRHPSVRDCLVAASGDSGGDKKLVAYFVSAVPAVPDTQSLRGFLREHLPDYMVPSAFVAMDAFPLTANGKVDRRALPSFEGARPELTTDYVAPATPVEQKIASVWRDVLNLDKVGLHDNFFDLGGHSLHLMQVHGRLKPAFDGKLAMVDLFKYPTVGSLARFMDGDVTSADAARESQDRGSQRRTAMQRRRASRAGGRGGR